MKKIEKYYNYMLENSPEFKKFVERNKNLSNDEFMQKYDNNLKNIIYYLSDS